MRAFDLDRFRRAQDAPQSSTAVYYGLDGAEEAAAYLRDDVLGDRLVTAASAVREHVSRPRPPRLDVLMGSQIDAVKLVSCMTLFERPSSTSEPSPRHFSRRSS